MTDAPQRRFNLTPNDVNKQLIDLSHALDEAADDFASTDQAWVDANVAYQVEKARVFLTTPGPMDIRKAQAVVETADLFLTAELAEQVHRASRERLKVMHAKAEAARSLRAAVKDAMSLGERGGP